jgi:hypothetical protein
MSQANVERVRWALAVLAGLTLATDPQTWVTAFFAPDVVWDLSAFVGLPAGSQLRGWREFSEFVEAWPYNDWNHRLFEAGENRVVATFHPPQAPSGSDPWIDESIGVVYTLEDGLIRHGQVYPSADKALEAAGLRE